MCVDSEVVYSMFQFFLAVVLFSLFFAPRAFSFSTSDHFFFFSLFMGEKNSKAKEEEEERKNKIMKLLFV